MKIKNKSKLFLLVLVTIILNNCAGSQVPLSPPGAISVDRQLIGIWVETDGTKQIEKDTMTIYQFNDHEYLIEYLPIDTNEIDLLRLRAYTTKIKDALFANVQCIECDDDNDYTLFQYELTKEDLLKIKPVKTGLYEDPLFTSSQELFDFIMLRMDDEEIYDKESLFRRVE